MNNSDTNSHGPHRVALVNDYEVIVAGLRAMLAPFGQQVEIVELDVKESPDQLVDVALFDTFGQPGLGLERVRELLKNPNVAGLAVFTWELAPHARQMVLDAGARGVISKALPASTLVDALVRVACGEEVDTGRFRGMGTGSWPGSRWNLSSRESETLAFLSTGMSNKELAQALLVSENTARTHLKSIYRKLDVTNRGQAIAKALSDPSFFVKHSGAPDGQVFDGQGAAG